MKRLLKYLRAKVNKFLEDLAAENQKMYGNKRLDCCELNRKPTDKP